MIRASDVKTEEGRPATVAIGMRRVDWVRIEIVDGEARCEVSGVGHRIPLRRPITLASAMALATEGVPTVVRGVGIPGEAIRVAG